MRIHAEHNRTGRIRNVPIGTNEEIRSSIIPRHRSSRRLHFTCVSAFLLSFLVGMKTISAVIGKALTRSNVQRGRSSRSRVSLNAVDRPRTTVQAFSEITSADHRVLMTSILRREFSHGDVTTMRSIPAITVVFN